MKKFIVFLAFSFLTAGTAKAQINLDDLRLEDLLGKVMKVEKGFAPKFSLGNMPINEISKVAEILGMKKSPDINKLFKTFRTGRLVYRVATIAGGAIAVYGLARKMDNSINSGDYKTALYSGLGSIASGLAVKFLTKGASYKAVDLFNGITIDKILDIFTIAPASDMPGIGIYVKL
ncbi:MAG: hypothetical protein J5I50_10545 [Chitinophagaceae bacterium]|nr:hypothetical protein [Chitinophagaceae bacterium]